jgi:hypothetical protein
VEREGWGCGWVQRTTEKKRGYEGEGKERENWASAITPSFLKIKNTNKDVLQIKRNWFGRIRLYVPFTTILCFMRKNSKRA